ncbi:MAG: glycosyltransferase family 9 protein [Planctomycetes bacterium]|nr:glycosyltransferase family 9 protein [Planctomycetota bacterium]
MDSPGAHPDGLAHLVLRAPNWVGDLVMATPFLAAAVRDPRFARVTIAVRAHLAPVLAGGPCAEHLAPVPRDADESALYRQLAPDGVVLFTNSLGAAWRAFRARIPLRAGAALSGRGLLLTHRVVPPRSAGRRVPVPTAHLLADVAGLVGIRPASLHPELQVSAVARRAARARLGELGLADRARYVLCTPSAAFGAAKMWPARHHARLLELLHERHGLTAVVTGAPGEEPVLQAVAQACRTPVIDLSGERRDLELLKALVAEAALLVSSDSGPRWFAAAFDVPCVTVMGPNFPELTASSLERTAVARVTGLECAPCLQRVCPLGHHRCMEALEPAYALASAERLLAAG